MLADDHQRGEDDHGHVVGARGADEARDRDRDHDEEHPQHEQARRGLTLRFPDHLILPRSAHRPAFHFFASLSFALASGCAKKRVRPQSRHTTSTNLRREEELTEPRQVVGGVPAPRAGGRTPIQRLAATFRARRHVVHASLLYNQYDITLIALVKCVGGSMPRGVRGRDAPPVHGRPVRKALAKAGRALARGPGYRALPAEGFLRPGARRPRSPRETTHSPPPPSRRPPRAPRTRR